jgi:hypothetical protein
MIPVSVYTGVKVQLCSVCTNCVPMHNLTHSGHVGVLGRRLQLGLRVSLSSLSYSGSDWAVVP